MSNSETEATPATQAPSGKGHKYQRKILMIDPRAQLKLLAYGCFSALSASFFTSMLMAVWLRDGDEGVVKVGLLAGFGLLLFALIAIFGMILSNQLCGPIYRLHAEVKAVLNGRPPKPIILRKGDHFTDVIHDFNTLAAENKKWAGGSDRS